MHDNFDNDAFRAMGNDEDDEWCDCDGDFLVWVFLQLFRNNSTLARRRFRDFFRLAPSRETIFELRGKSLASPVTRTPSPAAIPQTFGTAATSAITTHGEEDSNSFPTRRECEGKATCVQKCNICRG